MLDKPRFKKNYGPEYEAMSPKKQARYRMKMEREKIEKWEAILHEAEDVIVQLREEHDLLLLHGEDRRADFKDHDAWGLLLDRVLPAFQVLHKVKLYKLPPESLAYLA